MTRASTAAAKLHPRGFPPFHSKALAGNAVAGDGSMGTAMSLLGGHSILVVDDEPLIALGVTAALADAGAEVVTAHDLETALAAAADGTVSAAILDVQIGTSDCAPVCAALSSQHVPFMFFTGSDN